jgi:hypothetical protein
VLHAAVDARSDGVASETTARAAEGPGLEAAFERAYESTFRQVYGYIRYRVGSRDAADDLTSQAFLRALARLSTSMRETEAASLLEEGIGSPEGEAVVESPPLQTEEVSLDGVAVVWDPDPDPPSRDPAYVFTPGSWPPLQRRADSSALRWEEDGVSYSLMGRSLTHDEAVDVFFSRRPLDEVE